MRIFMALMVLVGIVTVIGVIVIAVIETKRMERGKPSILSRTTKDKTNKTQREI